jgi:two-component system sensor histidine kinase/response regulator
MIAIVLRNLISNAIKISITDYGVGISEEDIPKLFKLDKNVSTSDTDGEQGSGMGLILCNAIVKKHNGEISVQGKEGRGSTFTIRIPQYKI